METSLRLREVARRLRAAGDRTAGVAERVALAGIAAAIRHRALLLSLVLTVIFFMPALPRQSADAGFMYGGDILGWYLPALAKTHALIHGLNFTAIDFSAFNGSSDFFLSPNFFAYHPVVVLYSLLVDPQTTTIANLTRFLVLLAMLHVFLACHFTIKLFTRFFQFTFPAAVFVAAAFAFSGYMINSLHQPPFLYCATLVPWTAYAALSHLHQRTPGSLVLGALPVLASLLAGYLPLGVACLALSSVLVAIRVVVHEPLATPGERVRSLVAAAAPFVLAFLVASPFLYSIYAFHNETSSAAVPGLFYSAHQLGELPQGLLRVFSGHFQVPGPYYEFTVAWGVLAILVIALFLLSPSAADAVGFAELRLLKACAVIYLLTVLAIYGEHSVVSDLVFYLVPQVGKMHIYQRFLLPAYLLFAVMLAIMLNALVIARPPVATRIAVVAFAAATFAAAYVVAKKTALAAEIGLNNYIVIELFFALLLAVALLVPGRNFVFACAVALFGLPVLDRMHDLSHGGNTLAYHRKVQPMALEPGQRAPFVAWLKRFGDREIVKYIDITPMWTKTGVETFPKVFPYYVLNDVRLSSYGGFTFYLSARHDYMRRMPVEGDTAVRPDWDLLANSGADFIVARASDLTSGAAAALFAAARPEDIYRLPGDVLAIPLRASPDPAASFVLDNGFVRVSPGAGHAARPPAKNLGLGKAARQSSDGGGAASKAVDGNTSGDFARGSVTHTARDPNAWWEVDLGAVETIDRVRVWNRTDCCGERLRDYWIFISEAPFAPTDTAQSLRKRARTWGRVNFTPNPKGDVRTEGVQGRYVRIQMGGTQPADESFLSLAEVEVLRDAPPSGEAAKPAAKPVLRKFETDAASRVSLQFEAPTAATIQYLFWDNPRLAYYLDGRRVRMAELDGTPAIEVPAGSHTFEVRYTHWPLKVFWVFYTLYALALAVAVIVRLAAAAQASRRRREERARGAP